MLTKKKKLKRAYIGLSEYALKYHNINTMPQTRNDEMLGAARNSPVKSYKKDSRRQKYITLHPDDWRSVWLQNGGISGRAPTSRNLFDKQQEQQPQV